MSEEEYVSALRTLNEALITVLDVERKRSATLEEKHRTIKLLIQRPGDQLGSDATKELRVLLEGR